uniref:Peptidase A2 domain-containing protein n=1 Tax=Chromera velia CCMP2878 TaxID=1169474 RepID=A0A0G4I3R0_9ALVE|eukprot:Cvel_1758.t1-p1 / transcript=Cvel_1758.t1 / gene=Cvel_1758 / organism=Chromera_velia_CCMP2878 / gene_product=hypothetical protein / transcript_product=hypothetical protein / location=Cvel_scaffold64:77495-81362(-) / protein_length=146 / sequence_SO=supercontig / SO=protein_coding / is_pseudo=false
MIRFQGTVEGVPVRILLDSAAGETYMSSAFRHDKRLPIRKLQGLIRRYKGAVVGKDGNFKVAITKMAEYTCPLRFSIQGYHKKLKFTLANLDSDYDIYLGMKWLMRHVIDPHVRWSAGEVTILGPGGKSVTIRSRFLLRSRGGARE